MNIMNKPELLSPAGNPEKLKVAIRYGADAVYLAGEKYSLRAMADNFTRPELVDALILANKNRVKVYVVINAFLHDEDLEGLPEYLRFLEDIGVAALIVSDLGVLSIAQESCSIPIHLSTQANCLSVRSAKVWKKLGANRIIVGRELTIKESETISREADIEVEMFVHGAMCMAYSGNCVISNYTAGRDSNRGGCIQSCRFEYEHKKIDNFSSESLLNINVKNKTSRLANGHFMSSRDQQGIRLIPEFIKAGIASLKIEGRMKSVMYVATLTRAYRKIIDSVIDGSVSEDIYREALQEIESVPHRKYFNGSMQQPAQDDSTYEEQSQSATKGTHAYLGLIIDQTSQRLVLKLYRSISQGNEIEFISPVKGRLKWSVSDIRSLDGSSIQIARQDSVVTIPRTIELAELDQFTVVRVAAE